MIYPRPQHHHKEKEQQGERFMRNGEKEHCNDDYYPISKKEDPSYLKKNTINKPSRPMSALNKKL
jgi:hypothetical protein